MGKRILMGVLGVVVGMIAGMVLMMGVHAASWLVYPIPDHLDPSSSDPATQEAFRAWIGTLPAGAFVLAVVAHGLGAMSGAAVAMFVSGRRSLVPALVVGALFTVAGIMNVAMIPHPAWFPFVDLPAYLLLALLAGKLLARPAPASGAIGRGPALALRSAPSIARRGVGSRVLGLVAGDQGSVPSATAGSQPPACGTLDRALSRP